MSRKKSLILRGIYALCLLGASTTHIHTLIIHGLFWHYNGLPLITCIYWTSLAFLDPVAAILLWLKPRIGLILTLLIIVSDVGHNTWITLNQSFSLLNSMYLAQVAFLFFVVFSFKYAWSGNERSKPSSALTQQP
jgi:hypothetical protein